MGNQKRATRRISEQQQVDKQEGSRSEVPIDVMSPRMHPRGKENSGTLHCTIAHQFRSLHQHGVPSSSKERGASQQLQLAAREGKMCSQPSMSHPDRQEGVCVLSLAWTLSQSSHNPLGQDLPWRCAFGGVGGAVAVGDWVGGIFHRGTNINFSCFCRSRGLLPNKA